MSHKSKLEHKEFDMQFYFNVEAAIKLPALWIGVRNPILFMTVIVNFGNNSRWSKEEIKCKII